MRRRRPLTLLLATVALACLATAPAARASWFDPVPGPLHPRQLVRELMREGTPGEDRPGAFRPGFALEADGYTIFVVGLGESVGVGVLRGKALAETAYVVRGTASRGRLQATFGKLGTVSMRFRPSARRTWAHRHRSCRGRGRFLVRKGVYVGDFRFRGEGGYVSAHVHRAKGSVSEVAPACLGSGRPRALAASGVRIPSEHRDDQERGFLLAFWHDGISSAEFSALEGGDGSNDYVVQTATSEGRMAILHSAILFGAGGTFTHDDALTTARVAPPPPFHGAATYRVVADGTKTWEGKLSVRLPGADIPLTGPPFAAGFELVPAGLFF